MVPWSPPWARRNQISGSSNHCSCLWYLVRRNQIRKLRLHRGPPQSQLWGCHRTLRWQPQSDKNGYGAVCLDKNASQSGGSQTSFDQFEAHRRSQWKWLVYSFRISCRPFESQVVPRRLRYGIAPGNPSVHERDPGRMTDLGDAI